jgi:hypothetical protein
MDQLRERSTGTRNASSTVAEQPGTDSISTPLRITSAKPDTGSEMDSRMSMGSLAIKCDWLIDQGRTESVAGYRLELVDWLVNGMPRRIRAVIHTEPGCAHTMVKAVNSNRLVSYAAWFNCD